MNDSHYEYFCMESGQLDSNHSLFELLALLRHVLAIIDEAWREWNLRRYLEDASVETARKALDWEEYNATSAQEVLDWADYHLARVSRVHRELFTRAWTEGVVRPLRRGFNPSATHYMSRHSTWADLVRDVNLISRAKDKSFAFVWSPDKHRLLVVVPHLEPESSNLTMRAQAVLGAAIKVSVFLPDIQVAAIALDTWDRRQG